MYDTHFFYHRSHILLRESWTIFVTSLENVLATLQTSIKPSLIVHLQNFITF